MPSLKPKPPGWHEQADHTGKAPKHKAASIKKKLTTTARAPMVWGKGVSQIEEAKKYKSSEDFVKAQGTPYYHGTSQDFDVFDKTKLGSYSGASDAMVGFHFTDNKDIADLFGVPEKTKEVYLTINKLFNPYDVLGHKNKYPELYEIIMGEPPDTNSEEYDDFAATMSDGLAWSNAEFKDGLLQGEILDRLKAKGYDGIKFPLTDSDVMMGHGAGVKSIRGNELIVFEPDQIKTKAQLIDIWKKAQGQRV